ncbi:MAG: hypothetical protein JSS32_07280 [Verrucomicrobia bacterium]|nr:hypothetical protein [Verrucomicrobiota bacterium]
MKIDIAEKLAPFSHHAGTGCLIPGTWWHLHAFPTLLRLSHGFEKIEIPLKLTGPVKDFTVELDLERNCVFIFGHAQEGYFRLRLEAQNSGFNLHGEKVFSEGIFTGKERLKSKEHLHFPAEISFSFKAHPERISFGNHKQQDWDLVARRNDLREILPPLLLLAQKIPTPPPHAPLLPDKKPAEIESLILSFFKAHFHQILVPRLTDEQHQGIPLPKADPSSEPCFLVQQFASWVRSLFFSQNERRLQILPTLPPSFDCGRFIGIHCLGIGTFDFEWSKFTLRQAILRADTPGEVLFDIAPASFRVRTSRWELGRRQSAKEPLLIEPGNTYFLDRFQK